MTFSTEYSTPRVLVLDAPGPAVSSDDPDLASLVKTAAASVRGFQVRASGATAANIWRRADAHPITLALLVLERYGDDAMTWRVDTLRETLTRDGIALSNANWTKLLAVRTLFTTPSAWRRWEVFHWVAIALTGAAPNFEFFEAPRLGAVVHAVNVLKLIDPAREFGEEVDKFIAAIFKSEGIPYLPEPLEFAARELEDPQLECPACGARHRDDDDLRCVTCGSRTMTKIPYEFAEQRAKIEARWKQVKDLPVLEAVGRLSHDSADTAVYALATNWDWAKDQHLALVSQLHALRK